MKLYRNKKIMMKLLDKIIIDGPNGCWEHTGSRDRAGYPLISIGGERWRVSRLTYEILKGHIPIGLEIDHCCRNRLCCNPDHLDAVTHGENMRRAGRAGSFNGPRNSQAKLTTDEVIAIKVLYDLPFHLSAETLAILFGVSPRTAYNVASRETYFFVEPPSNYLETPDAITMVKRTLLRAIKKCKKDGKKIPQECPETIHHLNFIAWG